jgi:hypothetical protein
MEPLTLAAIAVATTVMTKALEKTGEKLGEKVFGQTEKFVASLKHKSPQTITAIEKIPEAPLDYGRAVLEIEALAKADSEVAEELKTLVAVATEDPNAKLIEAIQEIVTTLKSQSQESNTQKLSKLAEKIGLVVYGGTVSIENFTL